MKIEKIVIELNGKKIDLSIKDAKELQKVLDDLFDKQPSYTPAPYPAYIERPYYHQPFWYGDVWDTTSSLSANGNDIGTLTLSNSVARLQ